MSTLFAEWFVPGRGVQIEDEGTLVFEYQRYVGVRFSDEVELPYVDDAHLQLGEPEVTLWRELEEMFPGVALHRFYPEPSPAAISEMMDEAREREPDGNLVDLLAFYRIMVPEGVSPWDLAATVHAWPRVDIAYVESPPLEPPAANPHRSRQTYRQSPPGVNADDAYTANHRGAGICVADIEQGWTLGHEDLPPGIPLLYGLNHAYPGHGAAVLSIVVGDDDQHGGLGIAPEASAMALSIWRATDSQPELARGSAVLMAALVLNAGDVLLLEDQISWPKADTGGGGFYHRLPCEVDPGVWASVRLATALGIVVIEAAGNGSHQLDNVVPWLQRSTLWDSNAIVVAGAGSNLNPTRTSSTNVGSRVDCHAWGENIFAASLDPSDTGIDTYRNDFDGTSGAAAIIAGVAAVYQSYRTSTGKPLLSSADMRHKFRDHSLGSPPYAGQQAIIGYQPDLKKLLL